MCKKERIEKVTLIKRCTVGNESVDANARIKEEAEANKKRSVHI